MISLLNKKRNFQAVKIHFVYMLLFRDRDKSNSMFYTGETVNIVRRYTQHLNKIRSNYLKRWHPNTTKKLVAKRF